MLMTTFDLFIIRTLLLLKASKSTSKNTRRSNSVQGPRPKRGNRPPVIGNKTKKGRMDVMVLVIAISCTLLAVAVGIIWKPASTFSQPELCVRRRFVVFMY